MSTSKANQSFADRDLMRYFDGELDAIELDESGLEEGPLDEVALEAWLEGDEAARDKLAGLDLAASLLAEVVDEDERADGIADAVMTAIEADSTEAGEAAAPASGARKLTRVGDRLPKPAEASPPSGRRGPSDRRQGAANDNSGLIFGAAGLAAAAAVALFVWGNRGSQEAPTAFETATTARATATLEPLQPAPETTASPQEIAAEEAEGDGVEIAAVDFGSQHGSVFYVAAGPQTGKQTAVVWISDAGGEP